MAPSLPGKLAHLLCVVVSCTISCFLTAVLADGRSVIVIKESWRQGRPAVPLPVITNPGLASLLGPGFAADALLGKTYGVGLHHDNTGRYWEDVDPAYGTLPYLLGALGAPGVVGALPTAIGHNALKHPAKFLECKDLISTGTTCCALGFIGVAASFFMILLHALAISGMIKQKIAKFVGLFMWLVYIVVFIVVIAMGMSIYETEWKCDQPVIPTLTLEQSFDLSYGIPFAIIGVIGSVVCFICCALISKNEASASV
jgi:hypothetical protein